MNKQKNTNTQTLWIARIWGSIVVAFISVFLIAHVYEALFQNNPSSDRPLSVTDGLLFLCFPVSTLIGLVVAYKKEFVGGVIAATGLALLFLSGLGMDIYQNGFNSISLLKIFNEVKIFLLFIAPPAVLYIIYGRSKNKLTTRVL